ncbi:microtubule cross-linking factor 2 [Trichomycterus rosablanca]|uniref:microtubule cross-linking factor 2 n=1 Tax=Trichomycterus rosablanca TaxID=2290929 RepID=UPI002F35F060
MTKAKVKINPLVCADVMNQAQSKTKDADNKSVGKRCSSGISEPTVNGKEPKRNEKARQTAPGSLKTRNKTSGRRKGPDGSSKDCNTSTTMDSGSEKSLSASDENKASNNHAQSFRSQAAMEEEKVIDCYDLSSSRNNRIPIPALGIGERSSSPFPSTDRQWNLSALWELDGNGAHEDLQKEIDELRSENEYLKDEMEELRSEMLEMRDLYMEEDMYQLQDLKQQLDQANKTCRILQYRLRKAERRSLRVAQTGQVDGELIRTLEHDVRVAKSVSLRLHRELEAVQKKSSQLEWENEELREQLQNLEVAKQVLEAEMDKTKAVFSQNSLKRRSLKSTNSRSEKKLTAQDDSADLKCQLHFAKEESALMCKKLTMMAVDCESLRGELSKYRLHYGDLDVTQATSSITNASHMHEAEVKNHLRLVEEEATLLSRRIVELEVENRGLKAEMNDMQDKIGLSQEVKDEVTIPVSVEQYEETKKDLDHEHSKSKEGTGGNVHLDDVTQILREELISVERNHFEDQDNSGDNEEFNTKVPCEQGSVLSQKDLDDFIAVRDQAMLVRSIIHFLIPPANNGFLPILNHDLLPSVPVLNNLEVDSQCSSNPCGVNPMLSPLTNGLDVLQAQLKTIVTKVEVLVNSVPTNHETHLISGKDKEANTEKILETNMQDVKQCPDEEIICHPKDSNGQSCNLDSLELLTSQLHWILQQWRQGKRSAEECLSESNGFKTLLKECETYSVNLKESQSTQTLKKNWLYLSREAALMDRENPHKTWDCPIMPPSCSELNLKKTTTQKSHTAPERTTLRIYYSPPSARRIYLSAMTTGNEESLKQQERQEKSIHHSPSNDTNEANVYDNWQDTLPFQWRSLIEEGQFATTSSNSSSGFQSPGVSSPSCLPLSGWEVSSNLSDDMKEMTASVLERQKGKDSIIHAVGVVSTGTQTQAQSGLNSDQLQTESSKSSYSRKHRPSKVTSFVFPRPQSISASLEKMSGALEKLPFSSTSPKPRQRHSSSSTFYSSSSSSNFSNSSSSLTSSSLSTSSSLTTSTRLETSRERSVWGVPQSTSSSSARARLSATLPGSTLDRSSDISASQKTAETNKYGLVQVFFHNVCGRGEKPNPTGNKVPVVRRDYSGLKKAEGPVSPNSRVPLVRNDSVTRIVNRRFIKQNRKDAPGPGQTETQGQCRNQTKTPKSKDKGFGTVTLEDGSCGCSSRTLASCFARVSRTNHRHTQSHCKPCLSAAGGNGNVLSR